MDLRSLVPSLPLTSYGLLACISVFAHLDVGVTSVFLSEKMSGSKEIMDGKEKVKRCAV